MSQLEKLVAKMRRNPRDVSPDELHRVLNFYGFERRNTGSSHQVYTHPRLKYILTIPSRRPIKFVYVKAALEAIDELETME